MDMTVAEVRALLREADADEFGVLERSLAADERKGVKAAVDAARRRLEAEAAQARRIDGLYAFDAAHALDDKPVAGLDEVGRGAVAGPLAVGAVVLASEPHIPGLDDSKKLTPEQRSAVAERIKESAAWWAVYFVDPQDIDANGMAASLRSAFAGALSEVERAGAEVGTVLIDGNPLCIDEREVNVVKGDAQSAAIAAASVVAKVTRDEFMRALDSTFPQYRFSDNKGYASPEHIDAIRAFGLSSVHRSTFCKSFMQPTLF